MAPFKSRSLYADRRRFVYTSGATLKGARRNGRPLSRLWAAVVMLGCAGIWAWILDGQGQVDETAVAASRVSAGSDAAMYERPHVGPAVGTRPLQVASTVRPTRPVGKRDSVVRETSAIADSPIQQVARVGDAVGRSRNGSSLTHGGTNSDLAGGGGLKAAGPRSSLVPRPTGRQPFVKPVRDALLRAGKDCVARRILAVWGAVQDIDSMRGAAVDLVDRGLALYGFPLRQAITRHRIRDARRYSRALGPRTAVAWRRVVTWRSLRTFLDAFAESLAVSSADDDGGLWMPGDIVFVKPNPRRARLMPAIVSDLTNDEGTSLLITLNPADKVALELHTTDDYPVRHHYRLTAALLRKARTRLGMRTAESSISIEQ